MLANNETGAIQPVAELARLAAERGVPVHTDAVQAVGRIGVDFHALGATTLAASSHKLGGPVGVGVLLVKAGTRLPPLLHGGGQQGGRRPGTVPVPLAVGMAEALDLWDREQAERSARWRALRDRLEALLTASLGADRVLLNGPRDARLPQTLNLGFPGLDGDALLIGLDLAGVSASLGSACASGATAASPTLLAMGVSADLLRSSVRFSLGIDATEAQIDDAAQRIAAVVNRISRE
jgi:cysteine desulfurase